MNLDGKYSSSSTFETTDAIENTNSDAHGADGNNGLEPIEAVDQTPEVIDNIIFQASAYARKSSKIFSSEIFTPMYVIFVFVDLFFCFCFICNVFELF